MSTLKIAIQKSGRLSEKSSQLLRGCGISLSNGPKALKAKSDNFPLEILFLRDDDIPQYVAEGVADLGIVGANVIEEKQSNVSKSLPLGFAKCRLSLAIPKNENYSDLSYFDGKKIATSYPVILNSFLKEKGLSCSIEQISGSVEIAPGIGLAQGICDIVSTGSTLLQNGLKEVATIYESQAILISNPRLSPELLALAEQLQFRIEAVLAARKNKYILLNTPNESIEAISQLLPGMKSPTLLPLAQPGWSSLHSVVSENEFWPVISALKELGAEGILVTSIEKMIR